MRLLFSVALLISLGLGGMLSPSPVLQEEGGQEPADQLKIEARKSFMRGKLVSNQKIVEGISTKNFSLIAEGAKDVKALVKGQHWFVLNNPEYQRFSEDMGNAASRLEQAAQSKNLDAATLRYFDLTLTCVDCHRYIETQKY